MVQHARYRCLGASSASAASASAPSALPRPAIPAPRMPHARNMCVCAYARSVCAQGGKANEHAERQQHGWNTGWQGLPWRKVRTGYTARIRDAKHSRLHIRATRKRASTETIATAKKQARKHCKLQGDQAARISISQPQRIPFSPARFTPRALERHPRCHGHTCL